VLVVGLILFYVIHSLNNPRLFDDEGLVWAVLVVLFNLVSMPIYFVRYVWREQRPPGSPGSSGP